MMEYREFLKESLEKDKIRLDQLISKAFNICQDKKIKKDFLFKKSLTELEKEKLEKLIFKIEDLICDLMLDYNYIMTVEVSFALQRLKYMHHESAVNRVNVKL